MIRGLASATRYPSMRSIKGQSFIATLGFGGVLINTLPLWIGELGAHPRISDPTAGALGSVTLLLAAYACLTPHPARLVKLAWPGLILSLVVFAVSAGASAGLSAVACCAMGFFVGVALSKEVSGPVEQSGGAGAVGAAMSIGLVLALVCYLVVATTEISALWLLALLAISLSFVRQPTRDGPGQIELYLRAELLAPFLWYMPFFIMMGAYWTYLDLFAARALAREHLEIVLLCSLITGAIGSALAGIVGENLRPSVLLLSLLLAAATGAATYLGDYPGIITFSILANGLFLFLFFPLYLVEASHSMSIRLAIYLAGFAFGGIIGAAIVAMAGYAGLSVALLLSGVAGAAGALRSSRA